MSLGTGAAIAADQPPADAWVTNRVVFPRNVAGQTVQEAGFETLRAETAGARQLRVLWQPARLDTNAMVVLMASADEPGHWPVRDWRPYPMVLSEAAWTARPPVDDIHVPLIYFVRAVTGAVTNVSPMRICHPQAAGLEAPSRLFWPFLEGFEHGTESWSLVTDKLDSALLGTDPVANSGYCSLKVRLPADRDSVTVATTRIRGWQLQGKQATGLLVWLRTKIGSGQARFTLHADAFNTNQVVAVSSIEAQLNDQWQKVSLPLASFPKLPVGSVDWFTIEFIGRGPIDFLVDDLQLLGPWKGEPE